MYLPPMTTERTKESPFAAWSALAAPLFRALWIASVVSNVGTWVQNVASTWQMTTLTSSALLVALMQTATALPIFLLALPAGAMADIVDLRRLLIGTQAWMLAAAAALGLMTLTRTVSPTGLLVLTFLLGLGSALSIPAWQAMLPELVERGHLVSAVTMNGVSTNLARAIGPALIVPEPFVVLDFDPELLVLGHPGILCCGTFDAQRRLRGAPSALLRCLQRAYPRFDRRMRRE